MGLSSSVLTIEQKEEKESLPVEMFQLMVTVHDIVAYLKAVAYEVRQNRWAFKLAANLSGRAQQA